MSMLFVCEERGHLEGRRGREEGGTVLLALIRTNVPLALISSTLFRGLPELGGGGWQCTDTSDQSVVSPVGWCGCLLST